LYLSSDIALLYAPNRTNRRINRNPAQHIHDNFPTMVVISTSSSDASIYQEESSSKRSSSRRARNASRSFQDYVCDDDNNSTADDTDADEDFRPNLTSSKKRSTASKRKTKKSSSPTTSAAPRQTNGVTEPFPIKLHKMLEGNGANGMEHIASWQPHGRCFVVHNQQDFVDLVMPRYFQQSKYPSFQRQLNLYGFKRITKGPDRNGYHHPNFLRGRPELTDAMARIKVKGTGVRKPHRPEEEPNFYNYPPLPDSGSTKASAKSKTTSKRSTKQKANKPPPVLVKGRGKFLSINLQGEGHSEMEVGHYAHHRSPNRIVTPPITPEGAYDRPQADMMDALDSSSSLTVSTDDSAASNDHQMYLGLPESPQTGAVSVQLQHVDGIDHRKMEFEAWPASAVSHHPPTTRTGPNSDICYFFGRPFHYLEAMHA